MMKTIQPFLPTLLLFLLVACGGAVKPVAITPTGAATTVVVAEPAAATPTFAPPVVSADAPLTGPVIAFTVEDSYEDTYLGLFDTATGAYRDLPSTLGVAPGTASWFDDGCGLYVDGRLFDLRGNLVWTPDPAADVADAHGS